MFEHLNPGQRRLFAALAVNFVTLGISMTIFGATVPQIIDGFRWDYLSTGIVMSAGALGGFLSALACGGLLRRFRPKPLLVLSLGFLAASLALFGKAPQAALNAAVNFAIGAGSGFSEVITNSAVVRMERPGESRLMNFMHASFCVGAAAGPLAVGILTAARIPFGVFFTCAGGVQALIIVLLAFQKFPDMHAEPEPKADAGRSAAADSPWKRALFWALVVSMFLYVGVELTYNGWIAEYAARHRAFGAAAAAGTVSIFWTGLLIGRILLSLKAKGKRQERLFALLALGSVVFYALTTIASSARGEASTPILQGLTWACAFLTGLFFSGCYPIIVSILGAEFGGSTVALGICSAAAGAGVLLFPLATGALASSIGLPLAMFLAACVDACLAALAISIALKRRSS